MINPYKKMSSTIQKDVQHTEVEKYTYSNAVKKKSNVYNNLNKN